MQCVEFQVFCRFNSAPYHKVKTASFRQDEDIKGQLGGETSPDELGNFALLKIT